MHEKTDLLDCLIMKTNLYDANPSSHSNQNVWYFNEKGFTRATIEAIKPDDQLVLTTQNGQVKIFTIIFIKQNLNK